MKLISLNKGATRATSEPGAFTILESLIVLAVLAVMTMLIVALVIRDPKTGTRGLPEQPVEIGRPAADGKTSPP